MSKKILIVEDDENILRLERDYLEANHFDTDYAYDGVSGLEMALQNDYALILLDIMLPGIDGLEICRKVRNKKDIPILMVSAKGTDFDKIKGLGFGADDYIVKPFSPGELVARVSAHISRYDRLKGNSENSDYLNVGNIKIDKTGRRVFVCDVEIPLTNKEFELMTYLAENPNTVFSKEELFDKIWNYDSMGETSTVTVHINRIRDKLHAADPNCNYINTVWGRGYRFNK